MERVVYRFIQDRASIYWSVVHIVAILFAIVLLGVIYEGGFFLAWFISFVVASLLLMILSVPRTLEMDHDKIVVNCVLDATQIEIDDIMSVRKVSPREIRWVFPIFGGCGFFGYYGHFFDFKHRRMVKLYATDWRCLVEVVDIYNDYYYISCSSRDSFIAQLEERMELREAEHDGWEDDLSL